MVTKDSLILLVVNVSLFSLFTYFQCIKERLNVNISWKGDNLGQGYLSIDPEQFFFKVEFKSLKVLIL